MHWDTSMTEMSKNFIFFFESVALFMAVFFFIQYRILKRLEYLWYTLYLLFLTFYYLVAIPEFFFHISSTQTDTIKGFDLFKRPVQFLISVFYTLFVMGYLGLKQRSLPLYNIFKKLLVLYVVLALGCFVFNYFSLPYDIIYYTLGLLLFPVQLYIVISLFKYKVPYAVYIIWGTIIVLVGGIVTLLLSLSNAKNPGGPINNANSYIPVMLSTLVDIFLFTVALQRKIADNEKLLQNAAFSRQQGISLERERIIADLHDDVGGGLSSIRMMSDLMAQQQAQTDTGPVNFAVKISATAKEIAQRMNTIIWSLNTENDTLQNFIEYVRQFGVSYFENSTIKFQCSTSEDLPLATDLSGVKRKNLFLIVKEALHNILKHSGATLARVYIHMDKKHRLCIEVIDDGVGIKENNKFGNGLKNMQNRMSEIHGSIRFNSNNGAHITVTVQL